MSTKLNNIVINPEFENLLRFKNDEEKIEHYAQMISYRILSEVEKLCDEKGLKKKDLAEMTGTSKSYITQLFTGAKSINTYTMAKFENVLDVSFEIHLKLNEESYSDFISKQLNTNLFTKKHLPTDEGTWYFCYNKKKATKEIVNELETENQQKQTAA